MPMSVVNIFALIAFVVLGRAAMYGYWLIRTSVLQREYKKYLEHVLSDDNDEKQKSWRYVEKMPEVRELLQRAHITEWIGSHMAPIGFGHVERQRYRGFDNLASLDKRFVQWEIEAFHEAKGFYKKGIQDSFNPIHWIERLLKLPGSIAVLAGVDEDSRWIRLSNVGIWVPVAIMMVYLAATQEPLHLTFKGWFGEIEIQQQTVPEDPTKQLEPSTGEEGREP